MGEPKVTIRKFTSNDATRMVELANNENVSINLRDQLPFPYALRDAKKFLKIVGTSDLVFAFAVESGGLYVGNIGLVRETDVYRKSAEIGYFIGEPYWGQGIATQAVDMVTNFGFETLDLVRIHCGVFEFNKASQRVLEKCGFAKEGVFQKAIIKKNKIWDEVRYAKIKGT